MKKTLALLLCASMVFCLAACTKGTENEDQIDIAITDWLTGTSEDPGGAMTISTAKESLNPLTGKNDLSNDMIGMRPYAVSVDNSDYNGWPQDGISRADIIIEMETEGGISRLMCLFSDTREIERIGPMRSLRDQFLEMIFPLDPVVVHVGTSVYADKAINENNFRTLDGNNIRSLLWTSPQRSSVVQTIFTSGSLIYDAMDAEGIKHETTSGLETFFNFADENETVTPASGTCSSLKYYFSSSYDGDFRYDEESEKYLKWQRGLKQVDEIYDNEQLSFDNVILLYADISVIAGTEAKGGLIEIDYPAGGTGLYLSKGNYEEISWTKGVYASNIKLYGADGNELVVNTGNTHLGVIRQDYESKTVITG